MGETWVLAAVLVFVLVMTAVAYFMSRQMEIKLSTLASEFGTNAGSKCRLFGDSVISFRRRGTIFSGRLTRTKYACHYRVNFDTEFCPLNFQIKNQRPAISASYARPPSADSAFWDLNTTTPTWTGYSLSSNDKQTFESLIADPIIAADIKSYDVSWNQYIEILFEAGSFELFYGSDGRNSEQKLRHIFQTAINFHDRLYPALGE